MDWNTLLMWIAGFSCGVTLYAALRSSPRLKGWIFVSVSILMIGATLYFLKRNIAGLVAGALWATCVLAPALVQRRSRHWSIRQQYDRAARFATLAGILHPFDGLPQNVKFLRALSLADRGEINAAVAMLRQLETTAPPSVAHLAAAHACRLNDDWPGLISWVQFSFAATDLQRDANLLPMYVRALGEIGQLREMLRFATAGDFPMHPRLTLFRGVVRMYALCFCGEYEKAKQLLRGPLSYLPDGVQQYWYATALAAAGMVAEANQQLLDMERSATPGLALAIQRRRAKPPAPAKSILTDADLSLLHRLEVQQEQELRFSHAIDGAGRPWMTYALIAANVVLFAAEWAAGARRGNWLEGGTTSDLVLHRLGAMEPDVLQTGQYYRLFTANFLHYGYAHIAMNMLALLTLGPFVERRLGRFLYLLLYLVSGIEAMGTVLYLQLRGWMQPENLIGASGAIMAVIGATIAILLRGWFSERASAATVRLQNFAVILVLQVVFDHFTPQVSGAAHIAGLVWGFALASLLPHRRRSEHSR